MKKNLMIVIILLVALLAALCIVKLCNKQPESMPDIEQVESVNEEIFTDDVVETPDEQKKSTLEKITDKIVLPAAKQETKQVKTEMENTIEENSQTIQKEEALKKETVKKKISKKTSKYTPEEEELLKKIPRSEEVVVDKEIKVRTKGKFLFR